MKKKIAVGMGMLMSAALLFGTVGCVDMGDDPNTKPDDDPIINEDATVEITYATLRDANEQALMKEWAKAFMKKNKEVQITMTKTMGGMPDIRGWESGNELPDIIWTAGDQHAPYSGSGFFQNLADEEKFPGSAQFFSGFYDALIDSTHYSNTDSGIWFVPRDYNRLVVYINKTMFDLAQIEIPDNDWTWEEFMAICEQFAKLDSKIRPLAGTGLKQWFPIEYTMLRNFGGEYLTQAGEIAIEMEEYAQGVEKYYNFYQGVFNDLKDAEGRKIGGPLAYNDQGETFEMYAGGLTGCLPMMVDVRPQFPRYYEASGISEWELVVRSFPNFEQKNEAGETIGNGYVGAGCSGYTITKACTDETKREWAWKFLQFCMSEEGYETVAYLGNTVPALKSLSNTGGWREYGELDEESVNAFVDTHTEDIFLNYASSLHYSVQEDFSVSVAKGFYNNAVGGMNYAQAVSTFKQTFNDKIKK